ncbi:MAG: hypothetical protein E6Q95_05265 [Chitinophagaceae bacterium]|nr:MAG: hypothetical protein E6Q95_05265 [Chitinophagaceae bacterium]
MVTKAKTCHMEFYFKRKDIEKLLKKHPKSEGIIVKHSVIPAVMDDKTVVNISKIEAYASDRGSSTALKAANGEEEEIIVDGCPYPPGCNV